MKEKNILEAALFVSGKPLSRNKLSELISKPLDYVEKLMEELRGIPKDLVVNGVIPSHLAIDGVQRPHLKQNPKTLFNVGSLMVTETNGAFIAFFNDFPIAYAKKNGAKLSFSPLSFGEAAKRMGYQLNDLVDYSEFYNKASIIPEGLEAYIQEVFDNEYDKLSNDFGLWIYKTDLKAIKQHWGAELAKNPTPMELEIMQEIDNLSREIQNRELVLRDLQKLRRERFLKG